MIKRLKHVSPLQCGIVLAALYDAISLIFVPFLLLASVLGAQSDMGGGWIAGWVLALVIPIAYALAGFVGGIIAAAVYNLIAHLTGVLEITLVDVPQRTY